MKNSPSVADFLDDLVKTVSDFSLELQKDGTTFLNHTSNPHPYRNWDGGRLFKQTANLKVKDFMDKWTKRSRTGVEQNEGDTLIFPLLQMGPLGITQDEQVTSRIFQNAPKGSRSFLATGYFNLTSRYLEDILKAQGYYEVLCAHPLANGFYKAGGIIGKEGCFSFENVFLHVKRAMKFRMCNYKIVKLYKIVFHFRRNP